MRFGRLAGFIFIFALLAVLTGPGTAMAVKLGPVQVHPYLEFKTVHESNVYLQHSTRAREDWYWITSPGILLQLGKKEKNIVELEYRTDVFRYNTEDINNREDQFVRLMSKLDFGKLTFKLNDLGSRAYEPRTEQNTGVFGEPGDTAPPLSRFWSNKAGVDFEYALTERFKLGLGYTNYFVDYDLTQNDFRDRVDNGLSGTVYFKFMPKTSAVLKGIVKDINHNNQTELAVFIPPAGPLVIGSQITPDSREYWAMAGLAWDITAKSTGTLLFGYEWKRYPDNLIRKNLVTGAEEPLKKMYTGGVYEITLSHRFTPKTAISFSGRREAVESDDSATAYYVTTNGTLKLEWKPVKKVSVEPYASFASNRYSQGTTPPDEPTNPELVRRLDSFWYAGLDLKYEMNKYFSISGHYKHLKRSSTLTFYDYTDDAFFVTLRAQL